MFSSEKTEYIRDPTLSLTEKLRRHVNNRSRPSLANKLLKTDPASLNKMGPWVLLFVLCGAGTWGTLVAMPVLYVGLWEGWLVLGRILAVVMMLEATVNWCLTRWVSSEYDPVTHGTKPSDFGVLGNGNLGTCESGNGGNFRTSDVGNNVLSRHECEDSDLISRGVSKQNLSDNDKSSMNMYEERGGDKTDRASYVNVESNGGGGGGGGGGSGDSSAGVARARVKNRSYDGYSYQVFVAVALPRADGHVERKSYPYWSWLPCLMCQRPRPPRCHHCTLCQVCVLKRDHHCYMTGACIGANNQRFFIVFLVWAVLLTLFGTAHMLPYTFNHVFPDYNLIILDFLPPISLVRGLLGYISLIIVLLCALFWLLLFFVGFSTLMLFNFCSLLLRGQTSFERDNSIKVTDTQSLSGKLLSVFGRYWWLNFLVPTYPGSCLLKMLCSGLTSDLVSCRPGSDDRDSQVGRTSDFKSVGLSLILLGGLEFRWVEGWGFCFNLQVGICADPLSALVYIVYKPDNKYTRYRFCKSCQRSMAYGNRKIPSMYTSENGVWLFA